MGGRGKDWKCKVRKMRMDDRGRKLNKGVEYSEEMEAWGREGNLGVEQSNVEWMKGETNWQY